MWCPTSQPGQLFCENYESFRVIAICEIIKTCKKMFEVCQEIKKLQSDSCSYSNKKVVDNFTKGLSRNVIDNVSREMGMRLMCVKPEW
jgi:hypothetical protein